MLVRRYESTRRRHPMAADRSLAEAIDAERALLESVKANADVVVDTSDLNVHQLRDRVVDLFGDDESRSSCRPPCCRSGTSTACRSTPISSSTAGSSRTRTGRTSLRPLTGLDEPVRRYVLDQDVTAEFLAELTTLLRLLMPAYVEGGQVVPDHRLRLHRWTPPLGRHRARRSPAPSVSWATPRR